MHTILYMHANNLMLIYAADNSQLTLATIFCVVPRPTAEHNKILLLANMRVSRRQHKITVDLDHQLDMVET